MALFGYRWKSDPTRGGMAGAHQGEGQPMTVTTGTVVDARDGTQYRVTRMPDGRMWGVTPLSYATADSKLVNNNAANTALHGLLYRKADAVVNVPTGCVIPSRATILAMLNSLGLGTVVNDGMINSSICAALLHADDGGSDAFGFGLRRSGRWFSGYREFGELGWFYARDDVDANTYTAKIGLAPESGGFTNFDETLNWATTRFIVTDESVIVFATVTPVTYSPPAGTYGTPQTVTLSTETAGADIYYTVDGSDPRTESYQTGEVIDPTDGATYPVVWIAGAWWMQRNLAWSGAGVDYAGNPENRSIYGRLYTWAEAMAWVPSGWQIPTATQHIALINACGGPSVAGKLLKAISALWSPNTGTDQYGFSALPAGYRRFDTLAYTLLGSSTLIWSSSVFNASTPGTAYYMIINAGADSIALPESGNSLGTRTNWMSVRAIVPDSAVFNRRQSTLYTAPLTISESTTVKAIAVKAGLDDSAVTSAEYTIQNSDFYVMDGATWKRVQNVWAGFGGEWKLATVFGGLDGAWRT